MVGTGLAQMVPILVSPVLTRLYSPQEYGIFAAFTGTAIIMVVLATFRYELAIVLPDSEAVARAIAGLAGMLLIGSCIVYSLLIESAGRPLAEFLNQPDITEWIYALVPMVFLLGGFQVASYISTRQSGFRSIATAGVLQQLIFAGAAIALGYFTDIKNGLIVSRLSGQLMALAVLLPAAILWYRSGTRHQLGFVAKRYRQFPIFNFPYSLIGTVGREFFVIALTAMEHLAAAGFYGLARGVVFIPCGFLSSSLSNVFYKESTISFRDESFGKLTAEVCKIIGVVFSPVFAVLPVISPALFAFVFGEEWRPAGLYAAWLSAPAYLFLFSSWPERIFEVAERQRVSFTIQAIFDCATIGTIIFLLSLGAEPLSVIPYLIMISCLYHMSYIYAAFRVANFRWSVFAPVVVRVGALMATWIGIAFGAKILIENEGVMILLLVFLLAVYYLWFGLSFGRKILTAFRGGK